MLLLLAAVLQVGLTAVSLVGKLAYSYDLGAWGFLEGIMNARSHPNILFWNITRFNPFYCLLEVSCLPEAVAACAGGEHFECLASQCQGIRVTCLMSTPAASHTSACVFAAGCQLGHAILHVLVHSCFGVCSRSHSQLCMRSAVVSCRCRSECMARHGHMHGTPAGDSALMHGQQIAQHGALITLKQSIALQVLMGAAAARLVMVEGVDDEGKPLDSKPAPAGSVLLPIAGLLGITAARAAGEGACSQLISVKTHSSAAVVFTVLKAVDVDLLRTLLSCDMQVAAS